MSRERHGWLLAQLPSAMAQAPPSNGDVKYLDMAGFMRVFEDIANSVDDQIEALPYYFDMAMAPPTFLRWLGRWLALEVSPTLPPEVQRNLVRAVGEAMPWRGTAYGLATIVEAFTGARPEIIDTGGVLGPDDEVPKRKHIRVRLTTAGELDNWQLMRLIRDEIPADASMQVEVAGREVPHESQSSDESGEGRR